MVPVQYEVASLQYKSVYLSLFSFSFLSNKLHWKKMQENTGEKAHRQCARNNKESTDHLIFEWALLHLCISWYFFVTMKATKTCVILQHRHACSWEREREIQRYKRNEILLTTDMYIRKSRNIHETTIIISNIKIFFSRVSVC